MPEHPFELADPLDTTDDKPHEECGVFGVWARDADVARMAFFALYALQHRGQESAGIATWDDHQVWVQRGMGLVTQVFNEDNLRPLKGHVAIAHNRYSTTGASQLRNAQPYVLETRWGPLGLAHNGNLPAARSLREALLERGVGLFTSSDTEVITQILAAPVDREAERAAGKPDWLARMRGFMALAEGAYSLVVMTGDALWAIRDPLGLRPLCIGELELDGDGAESDAHAAADPGRRGYLVASESCALGTVGARLIDEVAPGEIVRIDDSGIQRFPGLPETAPRRRQALCVFEYVYFARPDSVLEDQTIHHVRQRLGARLWEQAPVEADVVIGVPDSATPAAIGFSLASGIPYSEGLTKNRYIGRTFIQPNDQLRRSGVRLKYNPLSANLRGKRVVMVDDSIVRGNTCGPLVKLLRDGGASEVHVRVSSPPVRHPCFMGVDMATYEQLIAHRMDVEGIRAHIGADSLAYLEHGAMMEAVREAGESSERVSRGHCSACFSGEYPIKLDEFWQSKAAHRSEQPGRFRGIRGD